MVGAVLERHGVAAKDGWVKVSREPKWIGMDGQQGRGLSSSGLARIEEKRPGEAAELRKRRFRAGSGKARSGIKGFGRVRNGSTGKAGRDGGR